MLLSDSNINETFVHFYTCNISSFSDYFNDMLKSP